MSDSPKTYTTGQAARILGVPQRTIQARAQRGQIAGAFRLDDADRWRVPRAWVDKIKRATDVAEARRAEVQAAVRPFVRRTTAFGRG